MSGDGTEPLMHRFPFLTLLLFVPFIPGVAASPKGAVSPDPLSAREIAFEMRYGTFPSDSPIETGSAAYPQPGGRADLQLHVLVTTALTVGGYYGSAEGIGWPHRTSLGAAAGGSLALGLLKELYDRSKIGNRFSGADMLMNVIGTGVGAGIAVGVR